MTKTGNNQSDNSLNVRASRLLYHLYNKQRSTITMLITLMLTRKRKKRLMLHITLIPCHKNQLQMLRVAILLIMKSIQFHNIKDLILLPKLMINHRSQKDKTTLSPLPNGNSLQEVLEQLEVAKATRNLKQGLKTLWIQNPLHKPSNNRNLNKNQPIKP